MTEKKTTEDFSRRKLLAASSSLATIAAFSAMAPVETAQAQTQLPPRAIAGGDKPNIILILSDDFGYGDSGPYGGGENRGMPTPSIDRLAAEGMQFMSFYAQPSCTPGRAAVQTGRIPNRSGMTTVAFQGQGAAFLPRSGRSPRSLKPAATRRSSPENGISARTTTRSRTRRATTR